jgi:hypothetical protein
MDQQDALNNAPDSPNWGNLPQYRMVEYPDIVEGKYYYFKNGNFFEDYIARVTNKSNNKVNGDLIYKRKTLGWSQDPDTEYQEDQWMPVQFGVGDLRAPLASMNDQAPAGPRKFYVYDDDVVMGQNGGGLVADINARLDDPSYILPAGTVARRMVPMMRTTPPFFPRKTLQQGRKNRRRASPSSVSRLRRSTRRANKKRATRRRR